MPYSGFSLSAKRGDTLYLWDETAEDPNEFLDSVAFSTNSPGRTMNFEVTGSANESVKGQDGAIEAVQCGDIGTPGFTFGSRPKLAPEFTGIQQIGNGANGIRLDWQGVGGATYRIEFSDGLSSGWSTLFTTGTEDFLTYFIDSSITNHPSRFYRLLEISP
jgi:hypothetical protein